MKKLIFISVLSFVFMAWGFFSCNKKKLAPEKEVAQTILVQIRDFSSLCSELQSGINTGTVSGVQLQNLFLKVRLSYKKFEWAAEYFLPASARLMNGPPVKEVELSGQVLDPAGLQVIEGYLFPSYDSSRKQGLIEQLGILQSGCEKYNTYFRNIDIFDWQVFDAAKLEVFRIMTLGITGFDNPLTQKSMPESESSLVSLQEVIKHYENKSSGNDLSAKLDSAVKYLAAHPDFNSFNRMEFIMQYGNPVTAGISDLQDKLKIKVIRYNRLLNQDARTLFDTNTFNVNAYAPDRSSFISDDKIALGQKLFNDPILSGTGKRSCQSCHQPEKAFADGMAKNTIIDQHELLERNTPTLINAALQPSLFYDLRVKTLEDQSVNVVQSNKEMHGSMSVSVKKLWNDEKYRRMFQQAFPYEDTTRIDTFEVMNAIGSYVRSLVLLNSRFDEYMRGNKTQMSSNEINGFNLFMGRAKCATCHYMPLFNGTFPPRYVKIESEVIGVPVAVGKNEIDGDLGRFNIIKTESFRHAFKTSTVRNAARTAPYMHNGVFDSLEQVMDFYNKGGGAGLGIKIENQTLPFDSLGLSKTEQDDIIAFMKSLDSKLPAP